LFVHLTVTARDHPLIWKGSLPTLDLIASISSS
jgi:hypothetical protein